MENKKEAQAVQSLDEMTVIIKSELENISEGFVAVGYYLKKTRDDELHRQKGYKSLFEYAEDLFGISRSVAVRFMEINDKYSIGGYSPQIEDRWRGYGSSKLTEMLGLPEEIVEAVPKTATVKEIREVKGIVQETKDRYSAQYGLCDITQEPEVLKEEWITKIVKYHFFHEGRERFKEFVLWLKSCGELNDWKAEIDLLELINPSKFKLFRLDTANVLMREIGIKVMPYRGQGDNREYTYQEFAGEFIRIFYPADSDRTKSAEEVFERIYGEPLRKKEETAHIGNSECGVGSDTINHSQSKDAGSAQTSPKADQTGPKPVQTSPKPAQTEITSEQSAKTPETQNPMIEHTEPKAGDIRDPETPAYIENHEYEAIQDTEEKEEQIPGQMEITKDLPEYCPEETENPVREGKNRTEEARQRTLETVQEGQVIADILKSGEEDRILKLLIREFAPPKGGWEQWRRKVVIFHD